MWGRDGLGVDNSKKDLGHINLAYNKEWSLNDKLLKGLNDAELCLQSCVKFCANVVTWITSGQS